MTRGRCCLVRAKPLAPSSPIFSVPLRSSMLAPHIKCLLFVCILSLASLFMKSSASYIVVDTCAPHSSSMMTARDVPYVICDGSSLFCSRERRLAPRSRSLSLDAPEALTRDTATQNQRLLGTSSMSLMAMAVLAILRSTTRSSCRGSSSPSSATTGSPLPRTATRSRAIIPARTARARRWCSPRSSSARAQGRRAAASRAAARRTTCSRAAPLRALHRQRASQAPSC